jgi:hypothetical protein
VGLVERRAAEPIIPLSLFRNSTFSLLLDHVDHERRYRHRHGQLFRAVPADDDRAFALRRRAVLHPPDRRPDVRLDLGGSGDFGDRTLQAVRHRQRSAATRLPSRCCRSFTPERRSC